MEKKALSHSFSGGGVTQFLHNECKACPTFHLHQRDAAAERMPMLPAPHFGCFCTFSERHKQDAARRSNKAPRKYSP